MKKQITYFLSFMFLFLSVLFSFSVNAAVLYVRYSDNATAWNGKTTYTDIAAAIAAAADGDEIWIAGGTYEIGSGGINYNVAKNLKFYGSFAGTETSVDDRAKVADGEEWEFQTPSILKMTAGSTCFWVNNSAITTTIDGLTLDGDNIVGTRGIGGGAWAALSITRCIIKNNNISGAYGVGILGKSKTIVDYCLVDNNTATKPSSSSKWGGAICILAANSSVKHSLIRNNSYTDNGAGIGIDNVAGVVISDCVITGNSTTANGGGVCGYRIDDLHNCWIEGNTAGGSGGGIYHRAYGGSGIIYNSIIVDNTATGTGGGITYHNTTNSVKVYNCVISGNKGSDAGVSFASNTANHQMINCILYDNKKTDDTVANVAAIGTNTVFKNNILDTNNVTNLTQTACIAETNPVKLFTDYTNKNFTPPSIGFAGLDKGDASNLSFDNNLDYVGAARIQGSAIEIGAYELLPSSFVPLDYLKIDGIDIEGFLQSKTSYNVALNSFHTDYPTIEAKATSTSAIISDYTYNPVAFDKDGINTVSFMATDGDNITEYSISFTVDIMPELSNLIISRIRADKLTRDRAELEAVIDTILPHFVDANGSFNDCHYVSESRGDAAVLHHLERLREMGIAYTQEGNKYYEDENIYNRIVKGLQFWYSQHWTDNNWYYNRISHPQLLGELFIAMYGGKKDIRNEAIFTSLVERWRSEMGDPDSPSDATTAGANKCNIAMHWIYRGCLTLDEDVLAKGADRSFLISEYTTGEGLQYDLSYRQHGSQLYIGGYGYEFIQLVTRQASYLAGTKYALSGDKLNVLRSFVLNTYLDVIRGQRMSFSTLGRGVTRQNSTKQTSLITILKMLQSVDTENITVYDAALKRLRGEESASYQLPSKQTHYYRGEYTLQVRPEYTFDVRMASSRMARSEYDIWENRQGFFLSDGATNILVDGEEYGSILPLWDWKKIPGVTMPYLAQMRRADSYIFSGRSSLAGGVTDGMYGVTAFDMINDQALFAYNDDDGWSGTPNNTGTRLPALDFGAKKSWFIFDKEIVCLGAGIYSGHDEPVYTTVNQCRQEGEAIVSSDNNEQTINKGTSEYNDVDWVLNDKVAYFFPEKPNINVSNETKTASWGDINTSYSDNVTDNLFTLWLNHGVRPENAKYAYIIVPNVQTATQAKAYQPSNIEILANTDSVQIVYQKELNIYGLAFFKACSFSSENIMVDAGAPCVLLVKDADKSEITAWVADPKKQSSPIKIGIKTPLLAEVKGITYENPASPYEGKSLEFTINNDSPKYAGKDVLLNRSDWAIIASSEGPVDSSVAPEGDVPEYIIDGNNTTSFLFVKPGKTYSGISVASDAEVSFTIDMKKAQVMTYLVYRHRDYNNTTAYLRVSKASFYGKNNESDEFVPIVENFDVPTNTTEVHIDFPEQISYRYVKFVMKAWDTSSGSTIQTSEFNLGNTVMPDDLPTDISLIGNSNSEIQLYPNPAKAGRLFYLKSNVELSGATISIYSLSGTKIVEMIAPNTLNRIAIEKPGIYMIEVKKNGKATILKAIVK